MPRLILLLLVGPVLAGCEPSTRSADAPAAVEATPTKPPIVARFDCDTLAVTATFYDGRVVLALPDRTLTLPRAVSASGARYSDEITTFWNKGREATFAVDGRSQTCRERRDPWQDARDRGVDFRAVGQEPGWFLEIDTQKQIRLVYDYAEREAITPVPAPMRGDGTTTYEAQSEAHRLRIVIEDQPCNDSMSGEGFPRSVTVTIDDRTLNGCGRDIVQR